MVGSAEFLAGHITGHAMRVPVDGEHGIDRDFLGWGALSFWLGPGQWEITEGLGVILPNGSVAAPGDWIIRTPQGALIACRVVA